LDADCSASRPQQGSQLQQHCLDTVLLIYLSSTHATVLGNLKAGLREAEVLELPPGAAISQVTSHVAEKGAKQRKTGGWCKDKALHLHRLLTGHVCKLQRQFAGFLLGLHTAAPSAAGGSHDSAGSLRIVQHEIDGAVAPPCSGPAWLCCEARCVPRPTPRTFPPPGAAATRRADTQTTLRMPVGCCDVASGRTACNAAAYK
jgi:hypothetical protein